MRKNKQTKSERVKNGRKKAKALKKAKKRAKNNFFKKNHRKIMFKHEIKRRQKFLESLAKKAMEEKQKKESPDLNQSTEKT